MSVVSEKDGKVVRSIINSDVTVDPSLAEVRYTLKPNKVFIFDKTTEERIRF